MRCLFSHTSMENGLRHPPYEAQTRRLVFGGDEVGGLTEEHHRPYTSDFHPIAGGVSGDVALYEQPSGRAGRGRRSRRE